MGRGGGGGNEREKGGHRGAWSRSACCCLGVRLLTLNAFLPMLLLLNLPCKKVSPCLLLMHNFSVCLLQKIHHWRAGCPSAGGAFSSADKQKYCASIVNKSIKI